MNSNENKICRLCLKTCNGNFETIQDKTKEILGVLVDMDFDLSEGCVNCKKCMETLQKCYEFISVCVHTEEKLICFLKSRNINSANMTQVYLEDMQTNGSDLSVIDKICRFCMKPVANFFALDEIVDEYFSDMLQKFLPEVVLNNASDSISCNNCLDSLKHYFTFLKHLLNVEENIRTYCDTKSEVKRGKVDLSNVVQHMLNKLSPECGDKETIYTGENIIRQSYFSGLTETEKCIQDQRKMQNIPIKEIKEDISDTENYYFEGSKEGSSQNYIKTEEIEIKTEETIDDDIERMVPLEEANKKICDTENIKEEVNTQNCIKLEEIEIETNEMVESDVERYLPIKDVKEDISDTKNYCLESSKKDDNGQNVIEIESYERCEEKPKKLQCPCCNYKTRYMGDLTRHLKCVHKISLLSCNNCFYKTNSEDCLNKHQEIHHFDNAKYKCPQCQKLCSTRRSIENHFLRKHNLCDIITSRIYSCNICSYTTTLKTNLYLHIKRKHSRLEKYQCTYCVQSFLQEEFLNQHISSIHLKLRPYICKDCKKTFNRKASLASHIVSHHQKNLELIKTVTSKIYNCDHCSFKSVRISVMNNHLKTHDKHV